MPAKKEAVAAHKFAESRTELRNLHAAVGIWTVARNKEKLAAASLENAKLVQKAADKTSDGPPGSPGSPPGSPGSPGVGHQEKAKETVERKTLELSEAKKALERAEQVRKRAYALADDFGSEQIKLSHPELQRVMKEIRVAKKYQGDTKEAPPAPAPP